MGRLFDFENDPITQVEKAFFKAMGARIAGLHCGNMGWQEGLTGQGWLCAETATAH